MGASKGHGWRAAVLAVVVLMLAGCRPTPLPADVAAVASDTPAPVATATLTPTHTPNPTLTPSLTPTASGTLTPTPTSSLTPTASGTLTPTRTPTLTPTASGTATRTRTPTRTPTVSPTRTPTQTPTAIPASRPTRTPTATPRRTPTATLRRTPTVSPTRTPTSTQFPCPQATSELLIVEPVQSPTQELSQWVTVRMGHMEMVTITTESGVFSAPDGLVEVQLLPNTTHHLSVEARVKKVIGHGGCVYGGYSLHTTVDRNGAPLVIVQGEPGPPTVPTEVIGPDNVDRLEELVSFTPEARLVTDVSFLGSDKLLSVGYAPQGQITGWSLTTGQKILEIGDGAAEALVVAASPDETLIATGGTHADPAVRVWEVETGEMRELGRHGAYLRSMSFSPSGALLASGDSDNVVQVWDVGGGQLVATFTGDVPGRSQSFDSLYWPDDQTLIAGGSDVVYTWNVASGQTVRRVPAPDGVPFLVGTAFAAGGTRIASQTAQLRVQV